MPAQPAAPDPIVFIVDDNDGVRETLELLFESVDQAVKSICDIMRRSNCAVGTNP